MQFPNRKLLKKPEIWNMRLVMGIAVVLGGMAVVRSFGLLYLAERVWALNPGVIQTMMYLTLSVGGHLTVFSARTKGPFWSLSPSLILLGAVIGTQILATLIVFNGWMMDPLPLKWIAVTWGYCLGVFVVQDQIKLLAYRMFNRNHSGMQKW